jgi:hypothetical protein
MTLSFVWRFVEHHHALLFIKTNSKAITNIVSGIEQA